MAGLTSSLGFLFEEAGVVTCDTRVKTEGIGNVDCGDGVSIGFDWGGMKDPILVVYRTPGRPSMAFEIPRVNTTKVC